MKALSVGNGYDMRQATPAEIGSLAGVGVSIISRGGAAVGSVEKRRAQRGQVFPWQAVAGVGATRRVLGSYYDDAECTRKGCPVPEGRGGGLQAAIAAVKAADGGVR